MTDEALTEFYRSRLMVPQVNPNTLARLASNVVAVLPGDMAVEFRAVPVSLDKDGNLTVAMSDPSDRHAVDEIAFFTGKYVVRAVATQMQIAWCLAQYYGHVTELGERLLQPVAADGEPAAPPDAGVAPAPANAAAPVPAAAPVTRQRGDTARVQAARHRVLAPVTTPPPVEPRPGPDALSRTPATGAAVPPPATPAAPKPSELAATEAEQSVTIEMAVDDPSGPVRLPSGMPAHVLGAPGAAAVAAAASAAATADAAAAAAVEQPVNPPGVEGGSPTIIVSHEATTPKRKRPALPDPPELAARSGEMEINALARAVDVPTETVQVFFDDDEPAMVVAPPVVIEEDGGAAAARPISDGDRADTEDDVAEDDDTDEEDAAPILLEKPRRPESNPALAVDARQAAADAAPRPTQDEPSGPVLLLERKKPGETRRRDKRTQLGIGVVGALGPIPRSPPAGDDAALAAAAHAAAAAATAAAAAAATVAAAAAAGAPESVPMAVHDDDDAKTRRVETRPPKARRASSVDDGWGPPGTTIPPPFLGAVVPADDPASGRIPVHGDQGDSAPLLLATPRADARPTPAPAPKVHDPVAATGSGAATSPIATRRAAGLSGAPDAAEQARAIEAAAIKLVEALRGFDQATTRDHVIAMLVDFVGDSHHRVAFLAAKPGSLTAFMQHPAAAGPQAQLPLSAPSVFQDVVGTRLPYRGPISDPVSREFVRALFGSTTDEMLAVPVAVRERVVGVIYADGRQRRAFDEHVAVAARAAGMALERLLKTKKG